MSADFYVILGVQPNCTQEEVENAYQNCIQDLDPHSSDPHILHEYYAIKEAYDVLSNPNAKERYDFFNSKSIPQGLNDIEPTSNWDILFDSITYNGKRERIAFFITVTYFVLLMFLTILLLGLRLDKIIVTSWWIVLAPLWVLCITIVLFGSCLSIIGSESLVKETHAAHIYRILRATYIFICVVLLLMELLAINLRLEEITTGNYFYVLIPYYVYYCLYVIRKICLVIYSLSKCSSLIVLCEDTIFVLGIIILSVSVTLPDNMHGLIVGVVLALLTVFIKLIRTICDFPWKCRNKNTDTSDISYLTHLIKCICLLFFYVAVTMSTFLAFLQLYLKKTQVTFMFIFFPILISIIVFYILAIISLLRMNQLQINKNTVNIVLNTINTTPTTIPPDYSIRRSKRNQLYKHKFTPSPINNETKDSHNNIEDINVNNYKQSESQSEPNSV